MDGYNADRIENEIGELVWQGSIDIQPDLNKDVVTSFRWMKPCRSANPASMY